VSCLEESCHCGVLLFVAHLSESVTLSFLVLQAKLVNVVSVDFLTGGWYEAPCSVVEVLY
jgi:hypothetical protein